MTRELKQMFKTHIKHLTYYVSKYRIHSSAMGCTINIIMSSVIRILIISMSRAFNGGEASIYDLKINENNIYFTKHWNCSTIKVWLGYSGSC